MHYDAFISYSSSDLPWGEKLAADLRDANLDVFFDKSRLQVGKEWEPQLGEALRNSRHAVVLWSNNAKQSDWVQQEAYRFAEISRQPAQGGTLLDRRLIVVLLEGESRSLGAFQMISDLKDSGAYAAGFNQLDLNLWRRVIERIANAIGFADPGTPVPVAILTTTHDRLAKVNFTHEPLGAPSLDALLETIDGHHNAELRKTELMQNYGVKRTDWKPFGGALDVWTILGNLKNQINAAIPRPGLRWEPLGERFWSNDLNAVREEGAKLISEFASVIIIDPIALYDEDVKHRFLLLNKSFQNENSVVLVLTPFATLVHNTQISSVLRNIGAPIFDLYFEPPIPRVAFANCSISVSEEADIKRFVLHSIGRRFRMTENQPPPVYTQWGGVGQ